MTEKKEYRVQSCGTLVPVTQEVYQAYYQAKRHDKTLCEKDERNGLVSYDGMDTEDILGEEMIPDRDAISVEDAVIRNILHEEVRRCVSLLEADDRFLVYALFYKRLTERDCARILGISQNAVNKRRHTVLAKLRKMIKN